MPGIVGIVSRGATEECTSLVNLMLDSMQHEMFYTSGTYAAPEMGIYAGWSAHENSFAAGQVFFNENHDVALIFSGECFFDMSVRAQLLRRGHDIQSSPGSWLVHLYEEEGTEFFAKLNGLFSGLLIDKRQGEAFVFNDRYGMERIYWHQTADAFYFASEAKALLRVLPHLRKFDRVGVAEFLSLGCTLEGRTLFEDIGIIPPASLWSFNGDTCRRGKYFAPAEWESQSVLPPEVFEIEFQRTFKRILPAYFEADSRVAISLTAGLDTRMIMACLPEADEKPVCYTFSGDQDTLDAQLSRQVANACGLEHEIFRLGGDFFSDFHSLADRTVFVTDGCLGVLGAHEIYLNSRARQLSPVRLTGVFGGEILRGVSMFKPLRLSRHLFDADFGAHLDSVGLAAAGNGLHPVSFAAFCEIPQKRFAMPAVSRSQVSFRTPYLDNEIVALAYRIPEVLRRSGEPALTLIKRNSARLSRIPTDLGDLGSGNRLITKARRTSVTVVRKLEYVQNEGLPAWMLPFDSLFHRICRGLKGFGQHKFLHYRSWFRRELAPYVAEVLYAPNHRSPFWNDDFIKQMAFEHSAGRANYVHEIDAVITMEAIERLLFRDLPRGPNLVAPLAISAICSKSHSKPAYLR